VPNVHATLVARQLEDECPEIMRIMIVSYQKPIKHAAFRMQGVTHLFEGDDNEDIWKIRRKSNAPHPFCFVGPFFICV